MAGVGITFTIMVAGALLFCRQKWRRTANQTDSDIDMQFQITQQDYETGKNVPGQGQEELQHSTQQNSQNRETNHHPESNPLLSVSNSSFCNDRGKIKFSAELTEKVLNLHSTSKREVKQDKFTVGDQIGSGNFGKVYKGLLHGIYDDNASTTVAIKSIDADKLEETQIDNMISEIKVMSNIPPHINISSMLASCSSQFLEHGDLWLILEFCQHGDLKNFLMKHKATILSGAETSVLNSRCLATWTYQIASGMQFLASNKIMHGDLALRNILLGDNPLEAKPPVAKVADFGLSKSFSDYVIYEKKERQLVPWRWMALEYLNDNYFTLKSDVWSFGVLLWEIFSFGKTPYGHQGYDGVLESLQSGYRLPCPKDIKSVNTWEVESFYKDTSNLCFAADPGMRATFSDLINMVANKLYKDELSTHEEISANYLSTRTAEYLHIKRV